MTTPAPLFPYFKSDRSSGESRLWTAAVTTASTNGIAMLEFEPNTLAFMTAALEQSCKLLRDDSPESRKFIGDKLIECARSGRVTLPALIEVGKNAAAELNAPRKTSGGRRRIIQLVGHLLGQ
jgi:hypothetical protein